MKGIVNVPARRAAVLGRMDEIREKTLAYQAEKKDIEIFMTEREETN